MNKPERKILLVTDDARTRSAILASMESAPSMHLAATCGDLAELAGRLESDSCSAVVVDIDLQPEQTLHQLDGVINRFPEVRFVVVSDSLRHELILRAMQAGARQFLNKGTVAQQLGDVLDRIIPNGSNGSVPGGSAFTILSAGGGCGATTLAVNLAHELQLTAESPSLVVDLDCCYGSAAIHLGADGMYGLREVLCDERAIDVELIRSTVIPHAEWPHLLMNPASIESDQPARLNLAQVPRLLRACREVYSNVIVDAPRMPVDTAAEMARGSAATVLIFQCNVRDLRVARAMHDSLIERGVAADSIVPLASRHRRRYSMISPEDAARALRKRRVGTLSNDFSSAQMAQNYGQPLATCAPRSNLRRDIRILALEMMKDRETTR